MLGVKDREQLELQGKRSEDVEYQLGKFKQGFLPIKLEKSAVLNDGISPLKEDNLNNCIAFFENKKEELLIQKFVPASGAASRMFKFLHSFQSTGQKNEEVDHFLNNVEKLPTYSQLKKTEVVKEVLALYSHLPKGLVPFHNYGSEVRTPFQEHIIEGELYASSKEQVHIHFTVPEKYQKQIEQHLNDFASDRSTTFHFTFSIQEPSTDTIAVDLNNNPVVDDNGSFVFRPGGHGSLINNLNKLDSDVIFVKNIDNVLPDNRKNDTTIYKKTLAGLGLQIQEQLHGFLKQLISQPNEELLAEIKTFVQQNFGVELSVERTNIESEIQHIRKYLNRPLRVCGMVKNEGEPGGGPFWVAHKRGFNALQIVEKSQIDLSNTQQVDILNESTHFNPVDLICFVKDYKGEKFNLLNFVDEETGFITEKSIGDKTVKAMELPGLWNGAMADWLTLFVEVPLTTFSPVKTLNDLFKPEHQAK